MLMALIAVTSISLHLIGSDKKNITEKIVKLLLLTMTLRK